MKAASGIGAKNGAVLAVAAAVVVSLLLLPLIIPLSEDEKIWREAERITGVKRRSAEELEKMENYLRLTEQATSRRDMEVALHYAETRLGTIEEQLKRNEELNELRRVRNELVVDSVEKTEGEKALRILETASEEILREAERITGYKRPDIRALRRELSLPREARGKREITDEWMGELQERNEFLSIVTELSEKRGR